MKKKEEKGKGPVPVGITYVQENLEVMAEITWDAYVRERDSMKSSHLLSLNRQFNHALDRLKKIQSETKKIEIKSIGELKK